MATTSNVGGAFTQAASTPASGIAKMGWRQLVGSGQRATGASKTGRQPRQFPTACSAFQAAHKPAASALLFRDVEWFVMVGRGD